MRLLSPPSLFLALAVLGTACFDMHERNDDKARTTGHEPGIENKDAQAPDAGYRRDASAARVDPANLPDAASVDAVSPANKPDTGVSQTCGNGTVETGEACDDGNRQEDDLCSADCLVSHTCGSGDLTGEITVKGRADIERLARAMQAQRCSMIDGDLMVYSDDLADLDGLEALTHITGNLSIGNCIVARGIPVYGGLYPWLLCSENPLLTSIAGLSGLVSIGGSLRIESNPELTSLSGLEALYSVGTALLVRGNDKLSDLRGLSGLLTVGEYLGIGDCEETGVGLFEAAPPYSTDLPHICLGNASLTSLRGLQRLSSIDNLAVGYNPSLASLDGLQGLDSLLWLKVAKNPLLPDLSGLGNLTRVEQTLYIVGNESLSSLSGLDGLTAVGERIEILRNESLSSCRAESFVAGLAGFSGSARLCENLSDECETRSCF